MKTLAILGVAITLSIGAMACDRNSNKSQPDQGAKVTRDKPVTKAAPAQDARSQYDLATDISRTEKLNPDEAAVELSKIRRDWRGKRYRWTVYRVAPMCRSTERCNVLPFDLAGADRKKVVQGWMPRIELTDQTFATLVDKCGDQPRCQFEFEGTLSQLNLSTEEFTSVHFSDVRIL